jgi:hypothetical protein
MVEAQAGQMHLRTADTDLLDSGGVFDQWHRYARQAFARKNATRTRKAAKNGFRTKGFQRLKLLDAKATRRCLKAAEALARDPRQRKADREYQQSLKIFDQDTCLEILDAAFGGPLDCILTDHFGSEYFVFKFSIGITAPTPDPDLSLLWHMDGGPPNFVNLLIYLNGSDKHGSTTEFLDRATSKRIWQAGYNPKLEERLDDLSPFARKAGVKFKPVAEPVGAGEGVLFDARYVLHRGRAPSKTRRYLLSLCILPSVLPWRESFKHWSVERLNAFDGGWGPDFLGALVPACPNGRQFQFTMRRR